MDASGDTKDTSGSGEVSEEGEYDANAAVRERRQCCDFSAGSPRRCTGRQDICRL